MDFQHMGLLCDSQSNYSSTYFPMQSVSNKRATALYSVTDSK